MKPAPGRLFRSYGDDGIVPGVMMIGTSFVCAASSLFNKEEGAFCHRYWSVVSSEPLFMIACW
ncbi:hypothetical protein HC62_03885 [Acetobacter tropicalis]|uniref:Uncharacterized protein n=1 Tax=Acetobacter tropicalis TaxID=104102 RepID=A0A252AAH0_9PROT|nr:hypothetical protein HC62_03885 [Acetobacter tropicalis]